LAGFPPAIKNVVVRLDGSVLKLLCHIVPVSSRNFITLFRGGAGTGKSFTLKEVRNGTKEDDIKLSNGWVIPKDYGNLAHGYCLTSYSSQSKGVDCVFVAESSESFRATDREQFYVAASRFRSSDIVRMAKHCHHPPTMATTLFKCSSSGAMRSGTVNGF
jgi:ATP-dependent exoDNAse (exonuclease V) alpha subunit